MKEGLDMRRPQLAFEHGVDLLDRLLDVHVLGHVFSPVPVVARRSWPSSGQ